MILGLTTAGFYDDLDPWQVGALRKVVVFRTLAQEQLENLADALEAVMKSEAVMVFSAITPGVSELLPCLQVSIGGRKVRTLGMGDYVGVNLRVLSAGFVADATDCFGDAGRPGLFNPEWGHWGCARFHITISS